MLFRNWGYKHKNNKGGGSEAPQALQYWKCNSQVNSILLWKSFSPGNISTTVFHRTRKKLGPVWSSPSLSKQDKTSVYFSPGNILTTVLHRKKEEIHEIFFPKKCHVKFWTIIIINHTTYLFLEPKPSVCSLTNLPLLVKKTSSWCWCCHSSSPPWCGHPPPTTSSRWPFASFHQVQEQWSGEVILHEPSMRDWSIAGVLLSAFVFLYQNEIFLKFIVILNALCMEHNPLALTTSQARVTTKKSLPPYHICREILKWWELSQIHSQQTIPLCPPCRSSTSLFSSRWCCQCPPPSQKNLFTDVGAGLLIHLLVHVIHLQQETESGRICL